MSTSEDRLAAVPEAGGAPGGPPAIETRGLTKRYPRVTALSDCSIAVPEGRISALIGPNGAGKTTLLRRLAGRGRAAGGRGRGGGGGPAVGGQTGAGAADGAGEPAGPGGGQAVRRPAAPGRPGADPSQAAQAAPT